MKRLLQATAIFLLLSTLNFSFSTTFAQGTAFTYQGRLNSSGSPANGLYDFQFALSNAVSGGSQIGSTVSSLNVSVTNGIFTTSLDFGAVLSGQSAWLAISVRTNGANTYTVLNPLQSLTPAPYAIFANTASNVSGSISSANLAGTYGGAITLSNAANQLSGAFTGNGANVTNVNASTLGGLSSAGFWKTTGNAGADPTNGAFLGTTDNMPLHFKVNGERALRLEYGFNEGVAEFSPNVIAGGEDNVVSNGIYGAFIGGGVQNSVGGNYGATLGAGNNIASGAASIVIGAHSTASGDGSIAMGTGSTASGGNSTAIGYHTTAAGLYSTSLGYSTTSSNSFTTAMGYQTFAGGEGSTAVGYQAAAGGFAAAAVGYQTIAGGVCAIALGDSTTANGVDSMSAGFGSVAKHDGSFVWGDRSTDDPFSTTAKNQFLIRATGGVGINTTNPASPLTVKTANSAHGIEQTDGTIRMATYVGGTINGGYFGTVSNHKLGFYTDDGPADMMLNTNHCVGIGNASPTNLLQVVNAYCDGSSWHNASDRNLKQNFADLDTGAVLEKIVAMPIQSWSYKTQLGEKHIGPVAQDFRAAFGLGDSDRSISTVDEGGVALAAIQGLNEKLEMRSEKLEVENAELKARLEKVEHLLAAKIGGER